MTDLNETESQILADAAAAIHESEDESNDDPRTVSGAAWIAMDEPEAVPAKMAAKIIRTADKRGLLNGWSAHRRLAAAALAERLAA